MQYPPVVSVAKDDTKLSPESYFGEVFNQLEKSLNFTYVLVPNDGVFGNNDSGKWTGVVGMVHRGEVDVGIAHFTPTRYRKEVVDFAYPLMHAT